VINCTSSASRHQLNGYVAHPGQRSAICTAMNDLNTDVHARSVRDAQQFDDRPTPSPKGSALRSVGLGLITGASDDDPSAIGTYSSAGAQFGPRLLWTAPAVLPMMFVVVYLSSKLGQVSGKGLFDAIRHRYAAWVTYCVLIGVLIGNTCEAAADIGGIAAAVNVLVAVPVPWIAVIATCAIVGFQIWGSYKLIRSIFRWLALSLFAYIAAAVLSRPNLREVALGTLIPHIAFNRESLSILVAIIGTSLSAYIFTWQSNVEVEEEIDKGRTKLSERIGATDEELGQSRRDILWGMLFANVVMYFIMLSTSALYHAGKTHINSAAEAAQALTPIAGKAAGLLFAAGVVAVGFLAVPIMTTGAAYDLAQTVGWSHGLNKRPKEAKLFYLAIVVISAIAAALNFIGVNPMKALVWAGIVQGFSTPPLMFLIMLLTNDHRVMGKRVNGRGINAVGWITTILISAAALVLVVTLLA
jgi:Mn2+/Fe2+ NRAMP family transporter